jgi:hypothetical protein
MWSLDSKEINKGYVHHFDAEARASPFQFFQYLFVP